MKIGNQMQNHKIETDSKLIYEDGSIWSTLTFIKIIGSDTLWFPLPPSEVLCKCCAAASVDLYSRWGSETLLHWLQNSDKADELETPSTKEINWYNI